MTADFTAEDVQRGMDALVAFWDAAPKVRRSMAEAVLAAVLPEYTRRKRLEWEHDEACGGLPLVEHDRELIKRVRAQALRDAAAGWVEQKKDDWLEAVDPELWLRARAAAEETP